MSRARPLAPAARRPPGGDGERGFAPDSSVAALLAGSAADGAPVRVAGRARRSPAGGFLLQDGGAQLPVRLRHGRLDAADELAWVGIEGRWDAERRRLVAAELRFLRRARIGASEAAARGLPEGDAVAEPERLDAVRTRARLLAWLRTALAERGYLEVQTPLLHRAAEAANVHQYSVEAVCGRRFFLRTDPEEYLKRYLTAGLEAVYEVSLNVRGEVPDADRLQEFTSVECYRRFATFDDMLALATELVQGALETFRDRVETFLHGHPVDLRSPPRVRTFTELVAEHTGLDLERLPDAPALAAAIRAAGWADGIAVAATRGALLEKLFDERVLPTLSEPTYVVEFPRELGLSACPHPRRPQVCLRGELYLPGGWELAHLYENLTESGPLAERLDERLRRRRAAGYGDAAPDRGLLGSTELGMPPMAGLAVGVDRLLLLVLGRGAVGQGLLFPREGFEGSAP